TPVASGVPFAREAEETASCSCLSRVWSAYVWQGLPYGVSLTLAPCQTAALDHISYLRLSSHLSNINSTKPTKSGATIELRKSINTTS
ncbi:hypothetical protein, partial [Ligilactobacillus agilis]|uniref:hypothetical protein n=1 Tax=Ligilactobacillus agilis TaxID=1601 RepID=UPI003B9722A2